MVREARLQTNASAEERSIGHGEVWAMGDGRRAKGGGVGREQQRQQAQRSLMAESSRAVGQTSQVLAVLRAGYGITVKMRGRQVVEERT